MELAIVIPYYKIDYFKDCLKSLVAQTNKDFKVYIGDDASPQDPSVLLQNFYGKLDFIYHRFSTNLGGKSLTRQWHRCINLSAGERWIMILGDDDYLSENYIEEFYKNLMEIEERDIKLVRFASRIVRSPSGEISKLYEHPKIEASTDFFFRKFLKFSRGSLTEQIFRRDAFIKHGFRDFPMGWGADNFAWLDFTEFGLVYAINSATAYFRISEQNISRGDFKEDIKQRVKYDYFTIIINQYLDKFERFQRIPLLRFYERIVYHSKKADFQFIGLMFCHFIREKQFLEAVKFFRRIILYKIGWNRK